jgi:DNA-binding transcriptional ArsR family regulator
MQHMERIWRDFKGVWIPKEIWTSSTLSLMEKVLFVEIHSLDNERGCFASNRHFADFFGLSDRQIRRHLVALKEKGFISITILNDTDRVIRAIGKYARVKEPQLRELRDLSATLAEQLSIHRRRLSTARPHTPDRNVHGGRT